MGSQAAQSDAIPGAPRRVGALPDWDEIFRRRPDLEPPGYRECVAWAVANTAEKKRLRAEAEAAKKTSKSPPKAKKARRR